MNSIKAFLKMGIAPAIAAVVAIYTADEVTSMLATITGITTLTPLLVEPLKQILKTEGWYTRILSAAIVYMLVFASQWLDFGFAAYDLAVTLIAGALMTLSVWGYVSITTIKKLLAILVNNIDKLRELKNKD